MRGTWRPLLDGEAAAAARRTAAEIAAVLAEEPVRLDPAEGPERAAVLASGLAGQALLFHYFSSSVPGAASWAEHGRRCLDEAAAIMAAEAMPPGLYNGFTGIAWVAAHLRSASQDDGGEDPNDDVDEALRDFLARGDRRDPFDLIGGLVGMGVYAVERLPRPVAVACLEAVVDRLAETAERHGDAVTWRASPAVPEAAAGSPDRAGPYDLGMAHGVPGVIGLLARACRAGVREQRARPLLEGAVRWLLAQQRPAGEGLCFPAIVGPGLEPEPARLAWCYGDAGIAVALLAAARLAGRSDWEREALAIAGRAAARPFATSGVEDAGLCHGAFGIAHLFGRLWQSTREEQFAQAARRWHEQGMALRSPGRGVAGFAAWRLGPDRTAILSPDNGFLTGAAGIGLALLAAASAVEPAWDRVLLAEVAPIGSDSLQP